MYDAGPSRDDARCVVLPGSCYFHPTNDMEGYIPPPEGHYWDCSATPVPRSVNFQAENTTHSREGVDCRRQPNGQCPGWAERSGCSKSRYHRAFAVMSKTESSVHRARPWYSWSVPTKHEVNSAVDPACASSRQVLHSNVFLAPTMWGHVVGHVFQIPNTGPANPVLSSSWRAPSHVQLDLWLSCVMDGDTKERTTEGTTKRKNKHHRRDRRK